MAHEEDLGFDVNKLVWTHQELLSYVEWASNLFDLPDEPLLTIRVDAVSEVTVSEEIEYDGIYMKGVIKFLPLHYGLVRVNLYVGVRSLLLGDGIAETDSTWGFPEAIEFSKGDVAKAVVKNSDRHDHIIGVRFFASKKEAEG